MQELTISKQQFLAKCRRIPQINALYYGTHGALQQSGITDSIPSELPESSGLSLESHFL